MHAEGYNVEVDPILLMSQVYYVAATRCDVWTGVLYEY